MAAHERKTPWSQSSGTTVVAACSCGWQSPPCANGEFANQAWERHVAETQPTTDEHGVQ